MKKPTIYSVDQAGNSSPIFSQGVYDVFVAALSDDKLPEYAVINRDTGVVEFTHQVTAGYRDFLNYMEQWNNIQNNGVQGNLPLGDVNLPN